MTDTDLWLRLDPLTDFGSVAGVFMEGGELAKHGHTPATLGMLDLTQPTTARVQVPELPGIGLDVRGGGVVRLVGPKPNQHRRAHPVLAEGQFRDEHPNAWNAALVDQQRAVLAIGRPPREFDAVGEWERSWQVGLIPLVSGADFSAFYTAGAA